MIEYKIKSSDDLMDLIMLIRAVHNTTETDVFLNLKYLPYSRADREFVDGDCFGLFEFLLLMKSIGVKQILTLDVHSKVAESIFSGFVISANPKDLIINAINQFAIKYNAHSINVLYPDEGASKRYELPASTGSNTFGIDINYLHASKKRDPETGKFLGFDVPDFNEFVSRPTLIVDDICDGGGTFVGIAKELDNAPIKALGLYVTHGIFSKGIEVLEDAGFTDIYTSDSWDQQYKSGAVTVLR